MSIRLDGSLAPTTLSDAAGTLGADVLASRAGRGSAPRAVRRLPRRASRVIRHLRKVIRQLATDRTFIAMTHRPSTAEMAGHIVFLEGGAVAERGTHAEFLAAGGRYVAFHALQQRKAST